METLTMEIQARPMTLSELKAAALQREMIEEQEQERQRQAEAFAAKLNWDKLVEFVKSDLHIELLGYANLEMPSGDDRFTERSTRHGIEIRLPGHAAMHVVYQRAYEGNRWFRELEQYTQKPYWKVARYYAEYNQYGPRKHVEIRWDDYRDLGEALLAAERNFQQKLEAEATVKEHNANEDRRATAHLEREQQAESEPTTEERLVAAIKDLIRESAQVLPEG